MNDINDNNNVNNNEEKQHNTWTMYTLVHCSLSSSIYIVYELKQNWRRWSVGAATMLLHRQNNETTIHTKLKMIIPSTASKYYWLFNSTVHLLSNGRHHFLSLTQQHSPHLNAVDDLRKPFAGWFCIVLLVCLDGWLSFSLIIVVARTFFHRRRTLAHFRSFA